MEIGQTCKAAFNLTQTNETLSFRIISNCKRVRRLLLNRRNNLRWLPEMNSFVNYSSLVFHSMKRGNGVKEDASRRCTKSFSSLKMIRIHDKCTKKTYLDRQKNMHLHEIHCNFFYILTFYSFVNWKASWLFEDQPQRKKPCRIRVHLVSTQTKTNCSAFRMLN